MFGYSFSIGRLFGVDLRVHATLPPLLALALFYSYAMHNTLARGFGLCAALLFGIIVREAARAMAAAWSGLHLRAVLIFPVGGVMAFASAHDIRPGSTRLITIVTPIANFVAGLFLLGMAYGIDPHLQLFAQPWISTAHVLRSFVWTQFLLGAVSLLPIASITSRALVLPRRKRAETTPPTAIPGVSFGTLLALTAVVTGMLMMHLWLVLLGGLLFLMSRLTGTQSVETPGGDGGLLVREAMQSEFVLLSSSDTLKSALDRTLGSPQEIFPITRGNRLVGSVAREDLAVHLRVEGDGYIQGLMNKGVPVAAPEEPLALALRRSSMAGPWEMIAVTDGQSVVGVLTHPGVRRAVQRNSFMKLFASKESEDE